LGAAVQVIMRSIRSIALLGLLLSAQVSGLVGPSGMAGTRSLARRDQLASRRGFSPQAALWVALVTLSQSTPGVRASAHKQSAGGGGGSSGLPGRQGNGVPPLNAFQGALPPLSGGKAGPGGLNGFRPDATRDFNGWVTSSPKNQYTLQVVAECALPNSRGEFRMRAYRWLDADGTQLMEPIAIYPKDGIGNEPGEPAFIRVHDQCFTSEVFGSQRCDCREQLEMAMDFIAENGGSVIYLPQEGRGIGLANKIAAYNLQDQGFDTVDANHQLGFPDDLRKYDMVPCILDDLGVKSVCLLTNNPFKTRSLLSLGVEVTGTRPVLTKPNAHNEAYLRTKALRMDHAYTVVEKGDGTRMQPTVPQQPLPRIRGGAHAARAAAGAGSGARGPSRKAQVILEKGAGGELEATREARWVFGRESVERALDDIRNGKVVVVVDDENRENEGDLIMAAEHATAETIGFFVRHTSGVICVALESDRLDELELPQMVGKNEDPKATAFTVTVDAKDNVSTGISARDRAETLRRLASVESKASDFCRPGHIFPLRARDGGVLVRQGHTEASVDLARLAGCAPAGVLCEITTEDSQDMARLPELRVFAEKHGLVLTSIEDILMYRVETGT